MQAIHEQTDIRVLLTGEISDELFGYKYTDFAPDGAAFSDAEGHSMVDDPSARVLSNYGASGC